MKLSKVFSLLKQKKNIVIMQGEDCQWIGDGYAMYPIYGLPDFTEHNLRILLDVKEDDWHKYRCEFKEKVSFSEKDCVPGEIPLIDAKMTINRKGVNFLPLTCNKTVYFIDYKYTKPLGDEYISYNYRTGERGGIIALMEGLVLRGVVAPILPDKDLVSDLREVCKLAEQISPRYQEPDNQDYEDNLSLFKDGEDDA